MTKLPPFLKKYFWDADYEKLNLEKNKKYIIERLLEVGNENAIRWLCKNVAAKSLKKVIRGSRKLSMKRANFWALFLNVPQKEVLCLSKHFQKTQNTVWQR